MSLPPSGMPLLEATGKVIVFKSYKVSLKTRFFNCHRNLLSRDVNIGGGCDYYVMGRACVGSVGAAVKMCESAIFPWLYALVLCMLMSSS